MSIIETKALTKTYGRVQAVRGIDLHIEKGEIFGLLGPNGAGKTTTIGMLCTIIRPTAGRATIAGYDIVNNPASVRRKVGIVFQDPAGYRSHRIRKPQTSCPPLWRSCNCPGKKNRGNAGTS